jgi:vitamin B12 transporter
MKILYFLFQLFLNLAFAGNARIASFFRVLTAGRIAPVTLPLQREEFSLVIANVNACPQSVKFITAFRLVSSQNAKAPRIWWAALLLIAFPQVALAQSDEDMQELAGPCYGCRKLDLRDVPTPITAITADDIIVRGSPLPVPIGDIAYDIITVGRPTASGRIEDMLRDVAGLTQFRRTDARSANATSQGATLRGLGGNASSRALLVLDGVPQSDPFGGWVTWPAFAPNRIQRVRVTRGGGSGAYGSGALAGTIEFESLESYKSSSLNSVNPTALGLSYGSRNSVDADAILAGKLGGGFAFLSASYARGDGFIPIVKGQRGTADIASPYEQISVAGRAIIPVNAKTELQANLLAFTDRRNRGTILSGNGGDGGDASVRLVHKGRWGWSALAYVQARKFQSRFVAVNALRSAVTQTVDQFNVPSTGLGARVEVRPPLGEDIELRLGSDWRRTSGETRELFTYVAGLPTRGREAGGVSETLGAFAELSAKLGGLTLTGGARADHWSIREGHLIERTLSSGALLRTEIAPDRNDWEGTGRVGLAYQMDSVTFRAAATLGWRLPTLNELYRPFRVGADAIAANPALAPERMKGAELGVDWSPGRDTQLRATLFTNRLTSAIANVTLATSPGAVFPGVGFVAAGGVYRQRQNLDAIRSRGIEVDASQSFGDISLSASYAYSDARVRARGVASGLNRLRPAQIPSHTASATLGWKGLSGTVRYVSGQFEDDQNIRRLNDALTFDAVATVKVAKSLSVTLRGENLSNARVEAAISGAGVVERATPRTIWVGLRYGM